MTRTIIDVHVLQTVPPSNVNRDDTGSPKTALYGGVRRARVSSQAWKRATRLDFQRRLGTADLGVRTKRVVELLAEEIVRQEPGAGDSAMELAEKVLTTAGIKLAKARKREVQESGYLLFLSRRQIEALAELAVRSADSALDRKTVQHLVKAENSIDVALFGRMVADVTDLNVDAAAQVAHAIGVSAVETEFDYFTAVDDHKSADEDEDAGAGMIGTVEFASATLYRYATVDVQALLRNLGDEEATARAVETFLESFALSMPTGKQNTFANRTVPDAVVLSVRGDQPVSWVGAFEDPVADTATGGRVRRAAGQMAAYALEVAEAYGAAAEATWVVGVGERVAALEALAPRTSLAEAVTAVGALVRARLAEQP